MQRFTVFSLDVWEDEAGFEVNDMWGCGQIELDNWTDFHDLLDALKANEWLDETCNFDTVRIHGDEGNLYVDETAIGRLLLQLLEG